MDSQTMAIVIWGYGGLVLLGGVIGFLKAKSKPSLIAGGVSGAVLIACGFPIWNWADGNSVAGCWVALVVTLVLLMFFGARFVMTKKMMPAGMMAALSLAALVLIIVGIARNKIPLPL
jgi:uncharacterized membrane protein (UPF0136 family)